MNIQAQTSGKLIKSCIKWIYDIYAKKHTAKFCHIEINAFLCGANNL